MTPNSKGRPIIASSAATAVPRFDKILIIPFLAYAYALIVGRLVDYVFPPVPNETTLSNRLFWPALAAATLVWAATRRERSWSLAIPPHIVCMLAYVAYAGSSIAWAYAPAASGVRFTQQAMVLVCILLPGLLAGARASLMRMLFLCCAIAALLNIAFVLGNSDAVVRKAGGIAGYFDGKNTLGEFATIAIIVALYEALHAGWRRIAGIFILVLSVVLLNVCNSKTALALALVSPLVALGAVLIRKYLRLSPALFTVFLLFAYLAARAIAGLDFARISYFLYGESTLTGRMTIWYFAESLIAERPWFGWGYQSFWLVGPNAPSVVRAPGWVKSMPQAHNGYYDTMLELGYIGLALLVVFVLATLHATGRIADRNQTRAWVVLSLLYYAILYNFLESFWMRGFEFIWVTVVIVVAEIGRDWQRAPNTRPAMELSRRVATRRPVGAPARHHRRG